MFFCYLRDARSFVSLFEYSCQLLHPIRSLDWMIIGCAFVFHLLLDVFPVQIPKSSLLGPGPARYKNPCPRHHFHYHFHTPHRPIHGSQRRNRHLYPLWPHRPVFVSALYSYLPSFLPLCSLQWPRLRRRASRLLVVLLPSISKCRSHMARLVI